MKKAVIYARYSSHNQREESIEGQLRKCHEYAELHGFTVIQEYCDRAISGKTDNRPEFLRMIKDADRGHFEAIIMYTLDRFARNRYDSAMYKAKLKKNGIRLFYTEQSLSDEPESIIFESVLEGMAEYYSENLSRGVKRGMRENALKGMITGGYTPIGLLKTADKRFDIDPKTTHIVKEGFDLALENKSDKEIRDIFNSKGYRNARGNPFTLNNIAAMLTNPKYRGCYQFEDIIIEDAIPRTVSDEVFNEVQEKRTKRKRQSGRMKAPAPYLLTGKLFCGHCGSPMRGESGTSKSGAIYNYYKCADRKNHKTCDKANEKKEWIERLVVEETCKQILKPDVIDAIAAKVAEITEKEYNDNSQLEYLNSELTSTQTAITNLLRLVEKGIDTEDVGERLLDLNSRKADLQTQISKEKIKKPLLSKEMVAFWLEDFITSGNIDDPAYMQRIIDTLVNKVYIFDEPDGGKKLVIFYNTSDKMKSTITLTDAVKCSDINCLGRPTHSIPNTIFFIKHCVGIVLKIEGAV